MHPSIKAIHLTIFLMYPYSDAYSVVGSCLENLKFLMFFTKM